MTPHTSAWPLRLRSDRRRALYISLTPLIDVVFILLVFFMLASSFLDWRAIDLEAPATAGRGGTETSALLLRVHAHDALDLNGRPVSKADLAGRLQRAIARSESAHLLIQPAAGVPIQRAVELLDIARAAGVEQVRLLRGAGGQR